MARQLTEQLEREVSAEELMKQTKSSPTPANTPKTNAPSSIDPYYMPNEPTVASAPPVAPGMPAPGMPAAPPVSANAAYSPETSAAVHGADWHASPSQNKPANE